MSMKSCHRRYCFSGLFFLLLFSINFVVTGEPADRYFQSGVQASRQQQNHKALKAFLQAKSAGLNSPELYYNLGVIYYKLGRYQKAEENFRVLMGNTEFSAVAFYNLGLIKLKAGKTEAAKQWFLKASDTTDPDLKQLSKLALQRVGDDHPSNPSMFTGWSGFLAAGGGYDDNVSLIDEDLRQTLGVEDYHEEITAAASRMLWGTRDGGIQLSADTDILEQQTKHRYDFSQWHVGLTHLAVLRGWKTSAGMGIDRLRFSNKPFQRLTSLEFRGSRRISKQTALELGYSYTNIEDESPNGTYDYLEGNLHQFRLKLTDKVKNVSVKYLYEIQLNDRKDYHSTTVDANANTTTTFTQSYSPLRNIFQITANVPVENKLMLVLGAQYRYSYYPDSDTTVVVSNNNPANSTQTSKQREDHRYKVNVGVLYSYNSDWQFSSYYSYTKNVSKLSGSNYRRSLISAGATWFF